MIFVQNRDFYQCCSRKKNRKSHACESFWNSTVFLFQTFCQEALHFEKPVSSSVCRHPVLFQA